MHKLYRSTLFACYCGSVVEAIAIHLPPLLFLTLLETYSLGLSEIAVLIFINFTAQLLCDLLAARKGTPPSPRRTVLLAHGAVLGGLVLMALLPHLLPPFFALCLSVALLGCGGGLLEIYVSTIIEGLPGERKAGQMSTLHSFYCWGHAGVILLSALFFWMEPSDAMRCCLPLFWAVIPLFGMFAFLKPPLLFEGEIRPSTRKCDRATREGCSILWLFAVMMFCGGAAEQTVAQWASGYAEASLGLSKTVGDLLCPAVFAVMMGVGRLAYGKKSHRLPLVSVLTAGCVLSLIGLFLSAVAASVWLSFVGCAITGLAVSIFWPGILSAAAEHRGGGVRLFAILALAGDVGCILGPALAGIVADGCGGDLRIAFLFAMLFPMLELLSLWLLRRRRRGT